MTVMSTLTGKRLLDGFSYARMEMADLDFSLGRHLTWRTYSVPLRFCRNLEVRLGGSIPVGNISLDVEPRAGDLAGHPLAFPLLKALFKPSQGYLF